MYIENSDFYKKAQEIKTLSKKISDYLINDLSKLKENGAESRNIYFSGDIVQQSTSIYEEILKVKSTTISEKKHSHARTLRWLTYRLLQNCNRLEKCSSNGKDFMLILRTEIHKFKKLQKYWLLSI
jgi:hypothetical protein